MLAGDHKHDRDVMNLDLFSPLGLGEAVAVRVSVLVTFTVGPLSRFVGSSGLGSAEATSGAAFFAAS